MSGKCPKDGDLVRLSSYETIPEESERLFRHLAGCSRCSVRFAVLRQVKRDLGPRVEAFSSELDAKKAGPALSGAARQKLQELGRPGPTPQAPPRLFGLRWDTRLAAGFLAVLVVVASGIYLTAVRSPEYSHLRGPSIGLTLIEPAGTIPAPPAVFRWSPIANAENYLFELYDESLDLVHTCSTFLINELVLGAEIRNELVDGRTYLWTISARNGDGELLALRSGTFAIE